MNGQPHLYPATEYHPPLPPNIPLSAINTLIPRLTTTINDIDSLKALIAAGNADGSLPSWDTLIQRYSLLLGRINALTTYLSPPAPTPTSAQQQLSRPGQPQPTRSNSNISALAPPPPPLAGYLVHPLNPLPSASGSGSNTAEAGRGGAGEGGVPPNALSPLAGDTFFQVINTIPLPSLSISQSSLLDKTKPPSKVKSKSKSDAEVDNDGSRTTTSTTREGGAQGSGTGAGSGNGQWHTPEQLRTMSQPDLDLLRRSLRLRLEREGLRANVMLDEISRREDEVDWTMRIDEEEDEDEDEDGDEEGEAETADKQAESGAVQDVAGEVQSADQAEAEDEDDDLFGGDDDDDDNEGMIIDVEAGAGVRAGAEQPMTGTDQSKTSNPPHPGETATTPGTAAQKEVKVKEGPRDQWKIADFVRFMDIGEIPAGSNSAATYNEGQ